MEWLNRKNRYGMVNAILFLACLGCLLSLSMAWRPKRAEFLAALLTFGLTAVSLGILTIHLLNRKNYACPKPEKDFFQVALESEHSSFFLPVSRLADDSDKSFLTFFVWIQRLGYVPCLKPSLEEAMEQGKAVVLIDPVKPFSPEEISKVKEYLHGGGTVLLMDSPRNRQSTANQVLKEFEMAIDSKKSVTGGIFDGCSVPFRGAGESFRVAGEPGKEGETGRRGKFGKYGEHGKQEDPGEGVFLGEFDQPACRIKGGDALLIDREGNAVLSVKKQGAGLIAVFGASHLFRDEFLGSTSMIPDEYQRWLSEMEFWIFESLARKEFVPFSLYSAGKV
jgi:hypothetical protein